MVRSRVNNMCRKRSDETSIANFLYGRVDRRYPDSSSPRSRFFLDLGVLRRSHNEASSRRDRESADEILHPLVIEKVLQSFSSLASLSNVFPILHFLLLSSSRRPPSKFHYSLRSSSRTLSSLKMAKSSSEECKVAIHWFRNGLRFHDNPCLLDSCQKSEKLIPLYVIDPEAPFAQTADRRAGTVRANFVLESMKELDKKLRDMGSELVVVLGKSSEVIPEIVSSLEASALFYEQEAATPVRKADAKVLKAIKDRLKQDGDRTECKIKGYATHTLHPMEKYLAKCDGNVAPSSYGKFTKIFETFTVPKEVEVVQEVPGIPEKAMEQLKKSFGDKLCMPTLEQLGYDNAKQDLKNRGRGGFDFKGGEDAGLAQLNKMMERKQWVATFEKPKTSPNNAKRPDTTALSPCKFRIAGCYYAHACVRHTTHKSSLYSQM